MHLGDQRAGGVEVEQVARPWRRPARTAARRVPKRSQGRRFRGSRPAPPQKRRLSPSASPPRAGCGRSRGARRPARRTSAAPARRSGWPGRRRRKSRAEPPAGSVRGGTRRRAQESSAAMQGSGIEVGFRSRCALCLAAGCPDARVQFAGQWTRGRQTQARWGREYRSARGRASVRTGAS